MVGISVALFGQQKYDLCCDVTFMVASVLCNMWFICLLFVAYV